MKKVALVALATWLVPSVAFAQGDAPQLPPPDGAGETPPPQADPPEGPRVAPAPGPGTPGVRGGASGSASGGASAGGRAGTPGWGPPPRLPPWPRSKPVPYVPHEAAPDAPPPPPGPARISWVRLGAGFRIGYIPTSGFDAYASNDVLSQLSLDGTLTLIEKRPWSLAAGLGVDLGGRQSKIRETIDTSLFAMRVTVPIEARWHLASWMYAFGKLAPGVAYNAVSYKDPASLTPLRDKGAAFAGDASLGASFMIGGYKNLDKKGVRFWVTPEVGYGFTTAMRVEPNAGRDEDDVTGTEADASFGKLALSGGFWKLGVGFTF